MKSEKLKLLESLTREGFQFSEDNNFYKVNHGKYKDSVGVCVGQFVHSCHVDSSDYYVLLFSDLGGEFVEKYPDSWVGKV